MGWAKLLPAIVLLFAAGSYGANLNTCNCWDNLVSNATLMSQLSTFNPAPTNPLYSYTGVIMIDANTSQPCVCDDVTRTQLNVTLLESFAYQAALAHDPNSLELVQQGLRNVLIPLDVNKTIASISANLVFTGDAPLTNWTLEIDTKGYNLSANLNVADMFLTNRTSFPNGTFNHPAFGNFNSTFNFVVLQCDGNPPLASAHGSRNWSSLHYPGIKATYSCDTGYFVSEPKLAYVMCSHDYINWTTPQINLTCSKGCQSDPPQGPYFSLRKWNSTQRNDGDLATYVCMNGYKSIDGSNGTSTCQSTTQNWTAIQTTFKCQQIICPLEIPQVPAFTQTNWDGQTVYIGTQITYTCIKGFSPTVKGTVMATCQGNGNWSKLPYDFTCINVHTAIRLGIYYPGSNFEYDYYSDGIYKDKVVTTPTYAALFAYVTFPTVIAITLIVLFLLCGTRTNSCIYWLCTGNTKKTAYIKA